MKKIRIFDHRSVDDLPWPGNEHCRFVKNLLLKVVKNGTRRYFKNIDAKLKLLMIDDLVLPLTVGEKKSNSSYVCSPYSHWINYGLREIDFLNNGYLRLLFKNFLKVAAFAFDRLAIDKTLIVNNFLLSTNFYPPISEDQLRRITAFLCSRYPRHAIAFRSINSLSSHNLEQSLKKAGYDLIISRMAYYTEAHDERLLKKRMYKSDLKLLQQQDYGIERIEDADIETLRRAAELYKLLNIDKYSEFNPQFREEFIEIMIRHPSFSTIAIKKGKKIEGIALYFSYGDTICSPCIGYDTALPKKSGLYRRISAKLLWDARQKGALLHQSSGCGQFKMIRGAKEKPEYLAVYHKHLPRARKIPWKILLCAMSSVGQKVLRSYRL